MVFNKHPFLEGFMSSNFNNGQPRQMLTWAEKHKGAGKDGVSAWQKANLDFAHFVYMSQYQENLKLVDNERIVNGELTPLTNPEAFVDGDEPLFEEASEAIDSEGLPDFLRNYDIIGGPIRQQATEFDERPDTLGVEGYGEPMENDYLAVRADYARKYAMEQLDLFFNQFLNREGIDPNQELSSEEEMQQFQEYIENLRTERTPEEFGRFMKYDYRHYFEEWANYEAKDQIQRFRMKPLRRREFLNYLTVGRRFRFLRVTKNGGFKVEPLNYVNVCFQKDQNVPYIQYSNFAGIIEVESSASIIDKYGHLMTEAQIKSFDNGNTNYPDNNEKLATDAFGNKLNYTDMQGNPYNVHLPSTDPHYNQIAPYLGINWVTRIQKGDGQILSPDEYFVINHFWRSYGRVGRLCWINPETGFMEVVEVDETFKVPDFVKVLKKATFDDEPEVNTIVWAWRQEIWQGVKISRNFGFGGGFESMYLDIRPMDYQGGAYNYMNKPLPIVGQVSYSPNVKQNTQVDILKPFAYFHNLAMNKAYLLLRLSYATFLAMDPQLIPMMKDWDGEDGFVRWLEAGQSTLLAPVDTSPGNVGAMSQLSQTFPREINLDNTAKALAAFNMANAIRQVANSMIGFTPQRLGDVSGIDSATGIEQGLAKSYAATESYFTEFWEAEVEIMQQQLQVAQWLQSQNKDFKALLAKGIISESVLTTNFDNFELYDLRVYVSNSQEKLRQRNLYERLALDNTTEANMSTRMEMVSGNSAQTILNIVKHEEEKMEERKARMEQQRLAIEQEANEINKQRLEQELELEYAKLENDLKKAWISSRAWMGPEGQDLDKSGTPDALEYDKLEAQVQNSQNNLGVSREQLAFAREKENTRKIEKQQELNMKANEINQKREQAYLTSKNVLVMDKGPYRGK